jgi:hypothetical protein
MTPKQSDFIASLASERDLPADVKGDYVRSLVAGTARTPDTRQASAIIEWLLELPRQASPEAIDVPAGRYAVIDEERSIVEFFVVDKPEEGKWAGRTFVSQQASDEKYPVRGARRGEVLARIAVDPEAALLRYGHELGRCGNCGRTLTDETSRAMGIGPDCAAKLGIGRPAAPAKARAATPAAPAAAPAVAPAAPAKKRQPQVGWRLAAQLVQEQQEDDRGKPLARPSTCSQDRDRPGCDIFGAPLEEVGA